jgi:hypothetical protein
VPAEATRSEAATPPKLRIWHLLLWMAGIGLMLAAQRWLTLEGPDEPPTWIARAAQIIAAAIEGAALAGLLGGAIERLGGKVFPTQPGEWLLVVCGTGTACDLAAKLVIRVAIPHIEPVHAAAVTFLPAALITTGIHIRAFQKCWNRLEWGPLFSTLAFVQACQMLGVLTLAAGGTIWYYVIPMVGVLAAVGAGYAVVIYPQAVLHDLLQRVRCGAQHWVGVVVLPLHAATYYLGLTMWLSG